MPGPSGRVIQGTIEVGRVVSWESNKRVVLKWRPASWEPDEVTEVEFRLDPFDGATQLTMEHRSWGRLIGHHGDIVGWFASEVAAPILRATTPEGFGDWITDRRARLPTGAQARAVYRDPLYHYPNFRVILKELGLKADDYLLEVGCGGGALLRDALRTECRAAAVDHSPDMVRLAREENRYAVTAGRLDVLQASADRLPFPEGVFTCTTMTGVLGFLNIRQPLT